MEELKRARTFFAIVCVSVFLFACGGAITGDGIEGTGLKGTVAVGAPLVNKQVLIKDRDGRRHKTTTNDVGRYDTRLEKDMNPPFILKVERDDAAPLFSIATDVNENVDGNVLNVHPLTDFVIRNWYGVKGRDIETEFVSDEPLTEPPEKEDVDKIAQSVGQFMSAVYKDLQIPDDFNLMSSDFDANSTGFDRLLDLTVIINQQNNITINVIDPNTQIQTTVLEAFDLNQDITEPDTEAPSKPLKISAVAASDTNVVLTWSSATDNIGIAGYNVYQNDAKIATVAFPVFIDANLIASTSYCYKIEAFDTENNISDQTVDTCVTTRIDADVNPPSDVTGLAVATQSNDAIKLGWAAVEESDVLAYRIYREVGSNLVHVATVIDTSFIEYKLIANTEYCYVVTAYDGAGNESGKTSRVCATTDAGYDDTAPAVVGNLNVVATSDSTIKLTWDAVVDTDLDGYRVFRGDGSGQQKIATVVNTIFVDQNLSAKTEYCYLVRAVDISGNLSHLTQTICVTTLAVPDNVAPGVVQDLVATAQTNSIIELNWSAVPDADVVGYYVYRKPKGIDNNYVNLGLSFTMSFADVGRSALTEYCYSVRSIDTSDNLSAYSTETCDTTKDFVGEDTFAPVTIASLASGTYTTELEVRLRCEDGSGSGCAATYYTLNGPDPTDQSTQYTGPIVISADTVLRFTSVDRQGNMETTRSESYLLDLPTTPVLEVVNSNPLGIVTSDVGGIDCNSTCRAVYASDTEVVLTATHSSGLSAIWNGCVSTNGNTCTVTMSRSRTVIVAFASTGTETESNNSFATAETVVNSSIVTGFLNSVDDLDYFKFDVTTHGTLIVNSSHPTKQHYLMLYNEQQQRVTYYSGSANELTRSLSPGTYYVLVQPVNVNSVDVNVPYTLKISGTVLGGVSPDLHEQNDLFSSATLVGSKGSLQGFLDTSNDTDYYKVTVAVQGTLILNSSHPSKQHYLQLYDSQQQRITYYSGTANELTRNLDAGIYYVLVTPTTATQYDLDVPYTLEFGGTTMGGSSPDVHEQNDLFSSATPINGTGSVQGYLDSSNDTDYYRIVVGDGEQGTLILNSSHPSKQHYLQLYDGQQQRITYYSGTATELTRNLGPGTYYVLVNPISHTQYDLNVPYTLTFGGTVMGGSSPDTHEQNDFFSTATPINGIGSVQGYLDSSNDTDYYRIVVGDGGQGTLILNSSHPSKQHYLQLHDGQQQRITYYSGIATELTRNLGPGTYYVLVNPISHTQYDLDVPYTLMFGGTVMGGTSPDTNEQNDLFSSATLISGVTSVEGYLDSSNDTDYYRFVVGDGEQGTLVLNSSHPSKQHYLQLYDGQQQRITYYSGTATELTRNLGPGTYYVLVNPISHTQYDLNVPYTLTFGGTVMGGTSPDTYEQNDLFSSATAINSNESLQGYLDTSNDNDYYVFTVSQTGSLLAASAHPTKNHYLRLYNDQQQHVATVSGTAPELTRTLAAGTYYLLIAPINVGSYDVNNPYSLNLTFTP